MVCRVHPTVIYFPLSVPSPPLGERGRRGNPFYTELSLKSYLLQPEAIACTCTGETPVLLNLSFLFFCEDLSFMLLI
jgi:hypothetical protein